MEESNLKQIFEEDNISLNNFAWKVFNRILMEIGKSTPIDDCTRFRHLQFVYNEMTSFQRKFENKKGNHTHRQYLISYMQVEKICLPTYQKNIIVLSKDCCEYCSSRNGKRVPLEIALTELPLDPNKCTRERGCICVFGCEITNSHV